MAIFSTPSSSSKKQPMAYSSLTAPSPFPPKSLFSCLKVLDEEESSSESGSPCTLFDSTEIGDRQERLKENIKSPTPLRSQRRTTDSFLPVCSLQALSRSSKKVLPRMSFSTPNIIRKSKTNKRPQTEKAKRGASRNESNNLTAVKIDMLNALLDSKNEEVVTLKSLLQQSEQKLLVLESKNTSLEEEIKQQQKVETPPILDISFGSDSEYNTEHDSQTMPYVPEEMLQDLTKQLQIKEREVEQWQEQAKEWKNKYQSLLGQMHSGAVSDEESVSATDFTNIHDDNECEEDDLEEVSGEEKDEEDADTFEEDRDSSHTNSDDKRKNDKDQVNKRSLRNRVPLGRSLLQNVQTPISNIKKRNNRRRRKTERYSPAAIVNTTAVDKVKEVSKAAPKTEDAAVKVNAEFGEVGYKFRKYFGGRYGSYDGEVTEILPDGRRVCEYPADPDGTEYLTLEELSKTKPLKQPRHDNDKVTSSRSASDVNSSDFDGGSDSVVIQVKKNVTCHICKNRRDTCVTFHCGKHSYCNNHCKKRLGFSATDVDRTPAEPPVIDYCPVCTLSCECSGCQRKLSSTLRK